MKSPNQSKPRARLEPRRVELVRSTHQPSKAELEESISLPPLSLDEAACGLMRPVEIHHIQEPRRESWTG